MMEYLRNYRDKLEHLIVAMLFVFTFQYFGFSLGISVLLTALIAVIYEIFQEVFRIGYYEWLDIAYSFIGIFFAVVWIYSGFKGFLLVLFFFILKILWDVIIKKRR